MRELQKRAGTLKVPSVSTGMENLKADCLDGERSPSTWLPSCCELGNVEANVVVVGADVEIRSKENRVPVLRADLFHAVASGSELDRKRPSIFALDSNRFVRLSVEENHCV